ncbi:MAG: hypothetical protein LBC79_00250 [Deltaproteobacteria bacterium]|jgi:hypothetical protein|nr:hypothetical protein [Deltaproteobacteria bacterium]
MRIAAPEGPDAIRCILGCALTILLFSYVSWGDFSWVTLTGPISLEPNTENMEGPGYVASPALAAVIVRLLFLLVCVFFCMIPNLAAGLQRHARFLLGLLALVYLVFSYLLGTLTFFDADDPGTVTLRIASVLSACILLGICYDAGHKNFKIPAPLAAPSFLAPLLCLFFAACLLHALIMGNVAWLFDPHPHFVLLRTGVFMTALTGALAFHAWRRGS